MSRSDIVEAIKTGEAGARVAPFAHGAIATVDPTETLDKAMEKLGEASAVGVVGADGVFKGLITPQSLAEVMLIKAARPDWRFSRRGS
jgi:CBS domain-containing protein